MTAKTLYFDESGYTGYNLLDPNQPVFAIASTDIEPAIAGTILRESFPDYQGEEFKFTNIWGSKSRRGLDLPGNFRAIHSWKTARLGRG